MTDCDKPFSEGQLSVTFNTAHEISEIVPIMRVPANHTIFDQQRTKRIWTNGNLNGFGQIETKKAARVSGVEQENEFPPNQNWSLKDNQITTQTEFQK